MLHFEFSVGFDDFAQLKICLECWKQSVARRLKVDHAQVEVRAERECLRIQIAAADDPHLAVAE